MNLQQSLIDLRFYYLSENLNSFIEKSTKSNLTLRNAIKKMIELELIEKSNRSTKQRLKTSKIGHVKLMADFNWAWPSEIERPIIEDLLSVDFIKDFNNVVFAGSQGVGKTMIAKNIGLQAISNGYKVLFTTAASMILDLTSQESTVALQRRLKKYTSPDLLIIDELGYLSFDTKSADLIFEIISQRYESGSIIITTNLAFKDWGNVFHDSACVTALIDRLTHHCQILKISASSYRTKEASIIKKKRGLK